MARKLIITRYKDGIATALFADGRAVALSYDREEQTPRVGNIYVGKVTRVLQNIQAAFVEIEGGVSCYYSLADNEPPFFTCRRGENCPPRIIQGDEILVQISREGVKTKAPTVTSNLTLSGKYLVLTTHRKEVCASSKLSAPARAKLIGSLETFADRRFGWIIRTNAEGADEEKLRAEAASLTLQMEQLYRIAPHRVVKSCLYRTDAPWLLSLKNVYDTEYEQILTDDRELYEQLYGWLNVRKDDALSRLSLYEDRLLPLGQLYPLERAFDEALRSRIWLKSGAYLVIEPTEALTAIDVNTGKCEHGKNAQDTFFKINAEAAHEIARQIRLRNLSGIILADFINMETEEQKKQLLHILDEDLRQDPVKACVVDMTRLGLVEITRKRQSKPLHEKIDH